MKTLLASILLIASTAYTLLVCFSIWFTFAFFFDRRELDWLGVIFLVVVALSPLLPWAYSLGRIAALRRGEHPRI